MSDFPKAAMAPAPKSASRARWLVLPLVALVFLQLLPLFATVAGLWGELLGLEKIGGRVGLAIGQVFVLLSTAILAWRLALFARYRSVPSVCDAQLPRITVIVPAYNEGPQVLKTLRSLVASDYPAEKLSIVAIDDGSVDDTWTWIERGRRQLGEQIVSVRFAANRGKRHALYAGFARARGEVVVTVDSDSEVLPDTLRNLVSPLVVNPRVGAVAGNVRVLNDSGILARMLDVSFTVAFELMRSAESEVNTVNCCPGALSAYRRDLVEQFKHEWIVQTFLGSPATIGEDRAMTNCVLKLGWLVKYQANAIVLTEVPQRIPQLCRMLLRWERSDVRESLKLAGFVFSRFRPEAALGARINLVWSVIGKLLRAGTFLPALVLLAMHPSALLWVLPGLLISAVPPAVIYAVTRGSWRALWAFPYALFSATCLAWIGPYALSTPHRSSWLTRQLPASVRELPRLEPKGQAERRVAA